MRKALLPLFVIAVGTLLVAGSVAAGVVGSSATGTTTVVSARQPTPSTAPSSTTATGTPSDEVAVLGSPAHSRGAEDNPGRSADGSWDADDSQGRADDDQGDEDGNSPGAPGGPTFREGD